VQATKKNKKFLGGFKMNEFEVDDYPSLFCDCGLTPDCCICEFSENDFTSEVEIYQKAIDKFQAMPQMLKLVEELGELTQATIKLVLLMQKQHVTLDDMISFFDEFADVEILLGQLRLLKLNGESVESGIDDAKTKKLKRLAGMVGVQNDQS